MSSFQAWLFRQPPDPPPYVVENTARTPPRHLATVFGIDWMATSLAWIAPLWMVAAGFVVASLMEADANDVHRLAFGILYAVLILLSMVLHQLGGAAAGAMAPLPTMHGGVVLGHAGKRRGADR